MLTVQGREIYTTLDELVAPEHTALLVIDMQNESCTEGELYATRDLSMYREIIPRIRELLDAARAAGVLVVHTRTVFRPETLSPAYLHKLWLLHARKYGNASAALAGVSFSPEGSFAADFVEELRPEADELVVQKLRPSAFQGTSLDLVLRSSGVETVLVTGIVTEGCVEATARDAYARDYYSVIVADCVASDDPELHDASMTTLRVYYELPTAGDVAAAWASAAPR